MKLLPICMMAILFSFSVSLVPGFAELVFREVRLDGYGDAQSVYIAGEFNNWNVGANKLEKDWTGIWTARLEVEPGDYGYKFVVNGSWLLDPYNKETKIVDGAMNSLLSVRAGDKGKVGSNPDIKRDSWGNLINGGFEESYEGATPEGWTRFDFGDASPNPWFKGPGIYTSYENMSPREGKQFLITGMNSAYLQKLTDSMVSGLTYSVYAEGLSGSQGRGYLYMTKSLKKSVDQKDGLSFVPVHTNVPRIFRGTWTRNYYEYTAEMEDAGHALYLVLDSIDSRGNRGGHVAWDEVFHRTHTAHGRNAIMFAKEHFVNKEDFGQEIIRNYQEFLNELEPVEGNYADLAGIYSKMAITADQGLHDWEQAEKFYELSLIYFRKLSERQPDIWMHYNDIIWIENELFWHNWRAGKHGKAKQIMERCKPYREALVKTIGHGEPVGEYRRMLQYCEYGKWKVDIMEAYFLAISGHPAETIAAFDMIITETKSAKELVEPTNDQNGPIGLSEGNKNLYAWARMNITQILIEEGRYERAVKYTEELTNESGGPDDISFTAQAQGIMIKSYVSLLNGEATESIWEEAAWAYDQASNDVTVARIYGNMHMLMKRHQDALVYFNQALQNALDQGQAQYMRKTLRFMAESKLAIGKPAEAAEDLVEALEISRMLADKTIEVELYKYYGRCAAMLGNPGIAFEVWDTALKLAETLKMPHQHLDILCDIATLQAKLNLYTELKGTWARIDKLVESFPDIAKVWLERKDRLRHAHYKLMASPQTSGMETASSNQSDTSNEKHMQSGQKQSGAALRAQARIVLQPEITETKINDGNVPEASFVLVNVSPVTGSGTISVQGEKLSCNITSSSDDKMSVLIGKAEGTSSGAKKKDISIDPGEAFEFTVAGMQEVADAEYEVTINWDGGYSAKATWRFGPNLSNILRSVADASAIRENPFYVIPFRHRLYPVTDSQSHVNVSVLVSSPCRIEYYDMDEDYVLGIDATGDGAFDGPGDALYVDQDLNGYPDVFFVNSKSPKNIALWVYPATNSIAAGGQTELEFSVYKNGEWAAEAVDVLHHTD